MVGIDNPQTVFDTGVGIDVHVVCISVKHTHTYVHGVGWALDKYIQYSTYVYNTILYLEGIPLT